VAKYIDHGDCRCSQVRGDKAIFIELLDKCCVGYFLEQAQYSRCCF